MNAKLHLEAAGVSDIGRQRQLNEDAYTSGDNLELFAIADGMGGHMHGDVASQETIAKLSEELTSYFKDSSAIDKQEYCYDVIAKTINTCNEHILKKNHQNGSNPGEGMGTTLVGIYFLRNTMQAITFNIGDSRLYRYRNQDLEQLTRDHTMYEEWVDAGEIGEAPAQNILVNAVGLVEDPRTDIKLENVKDEDVYLVCSDGLSGLVDNETLEEFINQNCDQPVAAQCEQLVNLANRNGGSDNITVILIRVHMQPSPGIATDANMQSVPGRVDNV